MNRDDLISAIRRTWSYISLLGLHEVFSGPVPLDASEKFKRVATDPSSTYETIYLKGLKESQYNILLKDFSYLQFGLDNETSVRFAYYPNPFIGASPEAISELNEMHEYVDEGLIDFEDFLHKVSELRVAQHPPPVRYEYSLEQYVEASHPASHFHIGHHGENRWPIRRRLTVDAFTLLVLRLFYLEYWLSAGTMKVGPADLTVDDLMHRARQACTLLPVAEFSAREGQRFHFT